METEQLLKILACPICHGSLELLEKDSQRGFLCKRCEVVYSIEDDIPVMLPNEAIPLAEWPVRRDGDAHAHSI